MDQIDLTLGESIATIAGDEKTNTNPFLTSHITPAETTQEQGTHTDVKQTTNFDDCFTAPAIPDKISIKANISQFDIIRRFSHPTSNPSYYDLFAFLVRVNRKYLQNDYAIQSIEYKDDEGDYVTISSNEEWVEAITLHLHSLDASVRAITPLVLDIKLRNLADRSQSRPQTQQSTSTRQSQPVTLNNLNQSTYSTTSTVTTVNNNITRPISTTTTPAYNTPLNASSSIVTVGFDHNYYPFAQSLVEHKAQCNNCHKIIKGVRYRCQGCDDYDLCGNCFNQNKDFNAKLINKYAPGFHQHSHSFREILKPGFLTPTYGRTLRRRTDIIGNPNDSTGYIQIQLEDTTNLYR